MWKPQGAAMCVLLVMCCGRLNVVYGFVCMVYVFGRRDEGVGGTKRDKGDQV